MKKSGLRKQTISFREPLSAPAHAGAFTLIELIAVVGVLVMIGTLLLPALAGMRPASQSFQCMNNARQMAEALLMYAGECSSLFPPNPDDGTTSLGYAWCADSAAGGSPDNSPTGSDGTFNTNVLQDPKYTLVAPFLNTNASPFRCPADPRIGPLHGADTTSAAQGRLIPAARSVSMNLAVGTIDPGFAAGSSHSGVPNLPTNGSWLNAAHGNRHNNPWDTFGKTTDFQQVKPAQIFLTADEDQYSIDDGVMNVSAATQEWIDFPGTYHNRGAVFSFCDGHVELHQWQGSIVVVTGRLSGVRAVPGVGADYADWAWMRDHTTIHQ